VELRLAREGKTGKVPSLRTVFNFFSTANTEVPVSPPPPLLDAAAARRADRRATDLLGLAPGLLMENAGRGLADVTITEAKRYGIAAGVVLAGRGNNGGDGFVAARHLLARGFPVALLLGFPEEAATPASDAGRNLRTCRALGIPILPAHDGATLEASAAVLPACAVVVDALLGTGLEGPVRGHAAALLSWLAAAGRPVVAADLPSGLCADTGRALGPVAACVATATFLAPKRGLLEGDGPRLAGRVVVCGLGFPAGAVLAGGGS
jgi:NAD(P)H-hydrate epimerase